MNDWKHMTDSCNRRAGDKTPERMAELFIVIVVGLVWYFWPEIVVGFNDFVDFLLFESPEQTERYKNTFGGK